MVQIRPAENLGPGGGQVRRSCTRPWLTFNLVQKHREGIKSSQGRLNTLSGVCTYSPPRKPSEIPPSGGFRFVGPRIHFRLCRYLFNSEICNPTIRESARNGSFLSVLNGASPRERRKAQRMGRLAHSVADKARLMRFEVTCRAPLPDSARYGAFSSHRHEPGARATHPKGRP